MAFRLDRRTVLRGIGGAMVGLPALECMLDAHGRAYAQSAPIPRRFAVVFAGQSIGGDGWAKDESRIAGQFRQESGHFIAPAATGAGYAITTPLEPLSELVSDFSIVSNMRIPFDPNNADAAAVPPAGAFRDFHGGGKSPLLCGVRSTEPSFRCNGITSDQVIANMHAGQTTFQSLVLRAQPSWYLSGSSYSGRQYISYRGPGDRIEAQSSPQIAFNSLFQGFTPAGDAEAARFDFRKRGRLSVLDLIGRRRSALVAKVGAADRRRLEQHFDEIRALELRVRAIPPVSTGECRVLPDPGADSPIGGDNAGSGSDQIATNTGYSDEDTRARLLADLIHMAFVCDLTRVATLQITVFQSHMNVFPITSMLGTPILSDQHEVGHNGDADNRGQIAVSTVLKWHVTHYAYLLQKLKDTPEGAGNLLDSSVIVFLPEGGHGTQLNDGSSANQTHSVENMVALIGGRAGGLNPGRHIDTNGAHPVQALISAMQAAGFQGDTLGEVTGRISELFT
jgi:hypothetical protein